MAFFLHRDIPFDVWHVVTDQLDHGETIALPDCHWFSEAQAEADRLNGKQDGGQGSLPI